MNTIAKKLGLLGKIFLGAAFLGLCLSLGFFAEWMLYHRPAPVSVPDGAYRIAMIGGSVLTGIPPRQLEKALESRLPGKKFFVAIESNAHFKLRYLKSVHDRVSETIEPDLLLVQVGCGEIYEPPRRDGPIIRLKDALQRWKNAALNNINVEFLYRYYQSQTNEEGLRTNEIRYAKLLAETAANLDWATIHHFNLSVASAPAPADGRLLAFPALLTEARFQLDKLMEKGLKTYDQRRTFLYLLDTARILDLAHEFAGKNKKRKRKRKRNFHRVLDESKEYEQLESFGERIESGWTELNRAGCSAYILGAPRDFIWERYWLCFKWTLAAGSSGPNPEINLSHPEDPLPLAHFLQSRSELNPNLLRNETARLIAAYLNERRRPVRKISGLSAERIEKNQNESVLDGAFTGRAGREFTEFVENARGRGESVWLLHYPETHYLGIEKLARKAGLNTVKAKEMFAKRITTENYSSYFTDSNDCGMGHVTVLGGELWTKRIADEISAFFRDMPAKN